MSVNDYVLARFRGEIERLGFQYRLWSPAAYALWQRGGLGTGARVLDAGCGPGFASLDLSERVGTQGHVTAFDGTAEYLRYLEQQLTARKITNVKIKRGVLDNIELPAASFDFIFTKMVLLFMPDLDRVMAEFMRLLKPGGKLLVSDITSYWYVSPPNPAIEKVIARSRQYFSDNGANPEIGRFLPHAISKGGFKLEAIEPEIKIAQPGSDLWRSLTLLYEGALPVYVEEGVIGQADADLFWQEIEKMAKDAGTFITSYLFLHIIAVK